MTPAEHSIHLLVEESGVAIPAFAERTWTVVEFERPVLYGSDEPISLFRLPNPVNRFLGMGPRTPN